MSHLSKPMIEVLSLYVLAMVMLRHCGQSKIANLLGQLLNRRPESVKQRLRELTYEATAKRGEKRQELTVESSFAPLLKWVMSKFKASNRQLVLALDVTYLSNRFTILVISVLVGRTGIPVAWHIQKGDTKGSWNDIWFTLLRHIAPAVPSNWRVSVLTDSGLYSKVLFKKLRDTYGWVPFMRIDGGQASFKPKGERKWQPVSQLVCKGMTPVTIEGTCFKTKPLRCTLSLQWGADYDKPCLIVTSLPPHAVDPALYALRYWIECGFKDFKRGFFHWEQTKMTCPQRAQRLWLVMSIAMLWLTALGEETLDAFQWRSYRRTRKQTRTLSAPVQGWITFLVCILRGEPLSFGFFPDYSIPTHNPSNTYP